MVFILKRVKKRAKETPKDNKWNGWVGAPERETRNKKCRKLVEHVYVCVFKLKGSHILCCYGFDSSNMEIANSNGEANVTGRSQWGIGIHQPSFALKWNDRHPISPSILL